MFFLIFNIYQSLDLRDVGDEWRVLTLTAETAINASVALVVYGDKQTSHPIILGQSVAGLFQAGNVDEFKV